MFYDHEIVYSAVILWSTEKRLSSSKKSKITRKLSKCLCDIVWQFISSSSNEVLLFVISIQDLQK